MEQDNSNEQKYGKRSIWKYLAAYLIVVLVVYGAYYFRYASNKGYTPQNSINAVTNNVQPVSPSPTTKGSKITVTATDFMFTPSTFDIKGGVPLEITFINNGTLPHNLAFPNINEATNTIGPGQQTVLTFTPTPGTYNFLCSVPGHADKGMRGTMIVQ